MKNKNFVIGFIILLLLGIFVSNGCSAEAEKKGAAQEKPPAKAMTKDEILSVLKKDLAGNEEEVFGMVPGLKAGKGGGGKVFYTFNNIRLEDLSKEELEKLSVKIKRALVKIRTDRISRQLETVKKAQNVQRINQPYTVPTPPPAPPSTKTPPAPPPVPPSSRK